MTGFRSILRALVTGPARRRPIRFLLPVLGVAIGVAAVGAIHHANSSVARSFRESATALAGSSDLAVVGAGGVPLEDLERLRFLWRVGSFSPLVSGNVVLGGHTGEVVALVGVDWSADAGTVSPVRSDGPDGVDARRRLSSTGAVLVPIPFARRRGWEPGDRVPVIAGGVRTELAVAGLLELSGVARAAGGDVLVTDVLTAARVLGRAGFVDRVDVTLDPGVSLETVREEISRRLPPGLRVEPAGRAARAAGRMTRAFRFNLNALGSLTLFVGMFLVANAVGISVLRRRAEIATLRALGASRASVFAAFLVEGALIGAAGTLLGELAGLGLARGALSVVSGTVSDLYAPAARITSAGFGRPALVAAAVGLFSAVLAALLPAIEATGVSPSPALRPGSSEAVRRRSLGARTAGAALALVLAAAATRVPPIVGFPLFGFAAVALIVAALALAAPELVRTGAAATRRVLERTFGAAGRLASGFFGGSLARNGLAVTALGMALGLTLAMIVTVASMRETVRSWVGATLRADLWVTSSAGRSGRVVGDLPPEVLPFLASIRGVAAVDPFRAREGTDAEGRSFTVASSDFRVLARAGGAPLLDGRDPRGVAEDSRARGRAFVSEPWARRFGAGAGGVVVLRTPRGPRRLPIAGVYRDFSNERGTVLLDRALYVALFGDRRVTSAAVVAADRVDPADLRRRLLAAARGRWELDLTTTRALRAEVLRIFDRTFAVTHALEGIAVAVAVLGIANALAASAVERRRSFALLRAIGASRGQIRLTVLLEALLIGVVAVVAALATGAAFAAILIGVINPQSFGWSVVPFVPGGRLAAAAALVLAASLAAALVPGRIASAADPATALFEE